MINDTIEMININNATVGIDLGDEYSVIYLLDEKGVGIGNCRIKTDAKSFIYFF